MSNSSVVAKSHLVFGRVGLGLTVIVWLSLAFADSIRGDESLGEAAIGIGVAAVWVLFAAGPYVIYLRYTTPVSALLTGVMLNAVMISLQLIAILYRDGQARFALLWAIVGAYVVVGTSVLIENFTSGYREGNGPRQVVPAVRSVSEAERKMTLATPGPSSHDTPPGQKRTEAALTIASGLLAIEFFVIPALWATGSLKGSSFWLAQAAFVSTLACVGLLIRRLKKQKSVTGNYEQCLGENRK